MAIEVQYLTDHVDTRLDLSPGECNQPRAQPSGRPGSRDVQNIVSGIPLDDFREVEQRGVQLGHYLFRCPFLRTEYL